MSDVLVDVKDVVFKHTNRIIYDKVNVQIKKGQITGIMGPSGTGKTTLLRLIGGQLTAQSGVVLLAGKDISNMSRSELFAARANMGVLFQSGALFSDMTVFENVAFPLRAHTQLKQAKIAEVVERKLADVGLDGASGLMPSELSGGMRRRAALARAIALDPALVMYDEPFAGQDPIVKGVLTRLIKDLGAAQGLTSIIVSHDVAETLDICDYIYVIAEGRVMGEGTPEQLKASDNAFVQQFLNGLPEGPVPFQFSAQHKHKGL